MTARLFREGDLVIGRFASGVRLARVEWADRHSDALCFVDRQGAPLGDLVGTFTSVTDDQADAFEAAAYADGATFFAP